MPVYRPSNSQIGQLALQVGSSSGRGRLDSLGAAATGSHLLLLL